MEFAAYLGVFAFGGEFGNIRSEHHGQGSYHGDGRHDERERHPRHSAVLGGGEGCVHAARDQPRGDDERGERGGEGGEYAHRREGEGRGDEFFAAAGTGEPAARSEIEEGDERDGGDVGQDEGERDRLRSAYRGGGSARYDEGEGDLEELVGKLRRREVHELFASPEPAPERRVKGGGDEHGQHDEEDGDAALVREYMTEQGRAGVEQREDAERYSAAYRERGGDEGILPRRVAACGSRRDLSRQHHARAPRQREEQQYDAQGDLIEPHRLRAERARHPYLEEKGHQPRQHRKDGDYGERL